MGDVQPVIRINALRKRYRDRLAVEDLNLEVRPGQIFGFLGPNGAGKTTTIRILLGLTRATSGAAFVLGEVVPSGLRRIRGRVGSLLESPSFYPTMSARANLRALAWTSGDLLALDRVDSLLERVGIEDRGEDPVHTYSLGMRQRLGLAAALLHEPEVLLLDEPVSGLDPAGIREVRDLLVELRTKGATIFLSSHLLSEVERVCDSVAVIRKGRIVTQGTLESLTSARTTVRLVVADSERAVRLLRQQGWGVTHVPPAILVEGATPEEVGALLSSNEMHPSELLQQRLSLEEVFLKVTEAGHGPK